jgi:hypothetical protein
MTSHLRFHEVFYLHTVKIVLDCLEHLVLEVMLDTEEYSGATCNTVICTNPTDNLSATYLRWPPIRPEHFSSGYLAICGSSAPRSRRHGTVLSPGIHSGNLSMAH